KGLDLWEFSRHYARTDTTISLLWLDNEDLPEIEVNRFGTIIEDDGSLAELTGELPWPGRSRRR
ncbi:MAG: ImmA/IrrE family metallo-endopeptidase, partial [Gammaproteobacteria bacterium]